MTTPVDASTIKACCASLYEHQLTRWLLGDTFHPGGTELTDRLSALLGLSPGDVVLDVAAGPGASALRIASRTGASVHGVDLSAELVASATERARSLGLSDRVTFQVGDAESLPLGDDAVNAVICECALCLFPEKADAVREMVRVVRAGGRIGIADVVVDHRRLRAELETLAGRVACIADARSLEENLLLLEDQGLRIDAVERHDGALVTMLEAIDVRLVVAQMALPSGGGPVDLGRARSLVAMARGIVDEGSAGYALIAAIAPGGVT